MLQFKSQPAMEDDGKRDDVDWSTLPQHLIYHIVTWMPLDSLPLFRKVCSSSWRSITYESYFTALHSHRTNTIRGYFVQSLKKNQFSSTFVPFNPLQSSISPPSIGFLPMGTRILSCTHRGIMLCESNPNPFTGSTPTYHVCKPTTQEVRSIPRPRTRFYPQSTMIVANQLDILHFKIVRLSNPRKHADRYTICEIFDSRTWSWRRFKDDLPSLVLSRRPGIEVNGVVHWLDINSNTIFAFDIVRETWKSIPLPEECDKFIITECNEQLYLIRTMTKGKGGNNDELQIWRMADDNSIDKWIMIGSKSLGLKPSMCIRDLYAREVMFLLDAGNALW